MPEWKTKIEDNKVYKCLIGQRGSEHCVLQWKATIRHQSLSRN